MKAIELSSKQRWRVVFRCNKHWQVGVYVPEYTSRDQIRVLEKHDSPELFYLVKGRIVLVLSSDLKELREVEMKPGEIYIVEEWHNAYRPDGVEGIALVIEKPDIKTEYVEIK